MSTGCGRGECGGCDGAMSSADVDTQNHWAVLVPCSVSVSLWAWCLGSSLSGRRRLNSNDWISKES